MAEFKLTILTKEYHDGLWVAYPLGLATQVFADGLSKEEAIENLKTKIEKLGFDSLEFEDQIVRFSLEILDFSN